MIKKLFILLLVLSPLLAWGQPSFNPLGNIDIIQLVPDSMQNMIPITDSLIANEYYQKYYKLADPHLYIANDSICFSLNEGRDTACVPSNLVTISDSCLQRFLIPNDSTLILTNCDGVTGLDTIVFLGGGGSGADTDVSEIAFNSTTNILSIYENGLRDTAFLGSLDQDTDTDVDSIVFDSTTNILYLYEDEKVRTANLSGLIVPEDSCFQSLVALSDTSFALTDCAGVPKDTVVLIYEVVPDDDTYINQAFLVDNTGESNDILWLIRFDGSSNVDTFQVPITHPTYRVTYDSTTAYISSSYDPIDELVVLPFQDAIRNDYSANFTDSINHNGNVGIGADSVPDYPLVVYGSSGNGQLRLQNTASGNAAIVFDYGQGQRGRLSWWGDNLDFRDDAGRQMFQFDTLSNPSLISSNVRVWGQGDWQWFGYGKGEQYDPLSKPWIYLLGVSADGFVQEFPASDLLDSLKQDVQDSINVWGINGLTNVSNDTIKLGGSLIENTTIGGSSTYNFTFDTIQNFNLRTQTYLMEYLREDRNHYGYILGGNGNLGQWNYNYANNTGSRFNLGSTVASWEWGDTLDVDSKSEIFMDDSGLHINPQVQAGGIEYNDVLVAQDAQGEVLWMDRYAAGLYDFDFVKVPDSPNVATMSLIDRLPLDSMDIDTVSWRSGEIVIGDSTVTDSSFGGNYARLNQFRSKLMVNDDGNNERMIEMFHWDCPEMYLRHDDGDWVISGCNDALNESGGGPHFSIGINSQWWPDSIDIPTSPDFTGLDTTYREPVWISMYANDKAFQIQHGFLQLGDYPGADDSVTVSSLSGAGILLAATDGSVLAADVDTLNSLLNFVAAAPEISYFAIADDTLGLSFLGTGDTSLVDLSAYVNDSLILSGTNVTLGDDVIDLSGFLNDSLIGDSTLFQISLGDDIVDLSYLANDSLIYDSLLMTLSLGDDQVVLDGLMDYLGETVALGQVVVGEGDNTPGVLSNLIAGGITGGKGTTFFMPPAIYAGSGMLAGEADPRLELGPGRGGNGNAYIDLTSAAGQADYNARIIRGSGADGAFNLIQTGAGNTNIQHLGTGDVNVLLGANDNSDFVVNTNNGSDFRVNGTGYMYYDETGKLFTNGNFDKVLVSNSSDLVGFAAQVDIFNWLGLNNAQFGDERYLYDIQNNSAGNTNRTLKVLNSSPDLQLNIQDADASASNEIQYLSLSGNDLTISTTPGSSTVTLPTPSSDGNGIFSSINGTTPNSTTSSITIGSTQSYLNFVLDDSSDKFRVQKSAGGTSTLMDINGSGVSNYTGVSGGRYGVSGNTLTIDLDGSQHRIYGTGQTNERIEITEGSNVSVLANSSGSTASIVGNGGANITATGSLSTVDIDGIEFRNGTIVTNGILIGSNPNTALKINNTTSSYVSLHAGGTTNSSIRFYENIGGTANDIYVSTIGTGQFLHDGATVTSDRRMKKNIRGISDAYEKVMQLKPVTYDLKKSGKKSAGFIAQEVREVFPYSVVERDHLFLDYQVANTYTTAAVQELIKENQAQKNQIDQLQRMFFNLQQEIKKLKDEIKK